MARDRDERIAREDGQAAASGSRAMADAADERTKKSSDPSRDRDQDQSRSDDGLVMSRAERQRLLRSEWLYDALPPLPKIPGWHVCWLTTGSQYDPIQKRIRMGYELLKADDHRGFENCKQHTGEYAGFIMVNEMIAAKLPLDIYNEMMKTLHHDVPLEEERAIREGAVSFAEAQRDSAGKQVVTVEEGVNELGRFRKPPPSFDQ